MLWRPEIVRPTSRLDGSPERRENCLIVASLLKQILKVTAHILCQGKHDSYANAHMTSLLQLKYTFQEGGRTTQMLLSEEGDTLLTLFGTQSGRIR